MRHSITYLAMSVVVIVIGITSCKKESSQGGLTTINKPPVANAGADMSLLLPLDSVKLDGSASTDPDGNITEWKWTKISGPPSFTFLDATISKPVVKNLTPGIYYFELLVKDNGGLFARDSVKIIITDPTQPNRPPVAYAGADESVLSTIATVNLNGSGSSDPDNNITSYNWTKISGPSSFNISNSLAVQTQVGKLTIGTYEFELIVTDAVGLFDKDTLMVTVTPSSPPCGQMGNLVSSCAGFWICANLPGAQSIRYTYSTNFIRRMGHQSQHKAKVILREAMMIFGCMVAAYKMV